MAALAVFFWSTIWRISRAPVCSRSLRSFANFIANRIDPSVRVGIGGKSLLVPWTHALPDILRGHPRYETELERLAAHIYGAEGRLVMIDVGANVGDTIARLPPFSGAKFLCIEPSPRFFGFLVRNYLHDPAVTPVQALVGESNGGAANVDEIRGGTGHVVAAAGGEIPMFTVDHLVTIHPAFAGANLLKVDTDGFDLNVLRGATGLLRSARPCLHIEFSPREWRAYGHSTLGEALTLLADFGYAELLCYDFQGTFLVRDFTAAPKLIERIGDYAERAGTHYNFIALHSDRPGAAAFYRSEELLR